MEDAGDPGPPEIDLPAESGDGQVQAEDLYLTKNSRKSRLKRKELYLFWIKIPETPVLRFSALAGAVIMVHSLYAGVQEWLFRFDGFEFGWFMTWINSLVFVLFSYLERQYVEHTHGTRRAPWKDLIFIGALTVLSMGLSNAALNSVNYPTQVLFKSSKLIPVMLMRILIMQKRYLLWDYVCAFLIVIGLTVFTLADAELSPSFESIGVVFLGFALVADALIGNLQEKTLTQWHSPLSELVFYSHMLGSVLLLAIMLYTGELWTALAYCTAQMYFLLFIFSTFSYLGVTVILLMIKEYGSVTAVVVTSLRKFVTIVASFLIFPKPFHVNYLTGASLIFLGIGFETYKNNKAEISLWLSNLRRGRPLSEPPPAPLKPHVIPPPHPALQEAAVQHNHHHNTSYMNHHETTTTTTTSSSSPPVSSSSTSPSIPVALPFATKSIV